MTDDAAEWVPRFLGGIVDATRDLVCCYKPNVAFFEALGLPGQHALRLVLKAMPADIPVLIDAKRGDTPQTMLAYARRVIIIPGYGLAVAQAQHGVRELAELLKSRGVEVKYAIHPVAGRMPGHMNVLLAEANVPYEELYDLDAINPEFDETDVALVIGANDVVNPAARSDPGSPIYGMPILDADKAQHIVIMKRSMKPGFAGIENELFYDPKAMMLFGDAKDSISKLTAAVKSV